MPTLRGPAGWDRDSGRDPPGAPDRYRRRLGVADGGADAEEEALRAGRSPVELVPRTREHVAALFPLVFRTAVTDTLVWDGPESEAALTASYPDPEANPAHRNFTILEAATGAPVGALSIRPGFQPLRGDVGYWVGIPFQGRGLGTAAVARALEIAFGEMGMVKVEASAFVGNDSSRRVLEKNGLSREGLVRSAILKRGRWLDEWIFGITREEWAARRGPGDPAGPPPEAAPPPRR